MLDDVSNFILSRNKSLAGSFMVLYSESWCINELGEKETGWLSRLVLYRLLAIKCELSDLILTECEYCEGV